MLASRDVGKLARKTKHELDENNTICLPLKSAYEVWRKHNRQTPRAVKHYFHYL